MRLLLVPLIFSTIRQEVHRLLIYLIMGKQQNTKVMLCIQMKTELFLETPYFILNQGLFLAYCSDLEGSQFSFRGQQRQRICEVPERCSVHLFLKVKQVISKFLQQQKPLCLQCQYIVESKYV